MGRLKFYTIILWNRRLRNRITSQGVTTSPNELDIAFYVVLQIET